MKLRKDRRATLPRLLLLCIPFTFAVWHISPPIVEAKLPPSLKRSSTGVASSKTSPLLRWLISDWHAPTPSRAIPPRRAPLTTTS